MNSEEKAFDEGWNAAYKGYMRKDNPYKRFTIEWSNWRDGNDFSHQSDPYWINIRRLQANAKRRIMPSTLDGIG